MLFWLTEWNELTKHQDELKEQLAYSPNEFKIKSNYKKFDALEAEEKSIRNKINKEKVIIGMNVVIPLVVSGAFMCSDGISINEIKEQVEMSVEMAKLGMLTTGGSAFLMNLAKLGMDLSNGFSGGLRNSAEFQNTARSIEKADLVKDFFSENEYVSMLDRDDILAVGVCYSHIKKNGMEKKNKMHSLFYKGVHKISDASPFLKGVHRKMNNTNLLGMKSETFHNDLFSFVDNILDNPINKELEGVFNNHSKLANGLSSKSKYNSHIFKTLEESFEDVYDQKQISDFKIIATSFVLKSSDNDNYFKNNKDKFFKYLKNFSEKNDISNNSDFFDDINKQSFLLNQNRNIENSFKERSVDYLNNSYKNDLLKSVENCFKSKMIEKANDMEDFIVKKDSKYNRTGKEVLLNDATVKNTKRCKVKIN